MGAENWRGEQVSCPLPRGEGRAGEEEAGDREGGEGCSHRDRRFVFGSEWEEGRP